MLFNSIQFFIFFFIVYFLYLILNHRWQNILLLVASYIFYSFWDWRFLSLIILSTVVDFICGQKIDKLTDAPKRKKYLAISIIVNLSLLGVFKYYNFFASSLQNLFIMMGFSMNISFFNIVLPVGISFYTFQTMSYTIDIYYRKLKSTDKFLDFALFVAFFPQLVAGPIERAKHLLPQVIKPRRLTLDQFYQGCYLIFWGLFLKVFVADNLARFVDPVFSKNFPYEGVEVLCAIYAFSFQIFGDFAGYSNIARGLGKCLGFDIMNNFNLPYFATNPQDFWRRWHISLSTWLKDYLYIPLGGNWNGILNTYKNLMITMLLGGLWHGANWTFICWGAYQGGLLVVYRLSSSMLDCVGKVFNRISKKLWFLLRLVFFFHIVCIGWFIFRSQSIEQCLFMMHSLLYNFNLSSLQSLNFGWVFYILPLYCIQIFQYKYNDLNIITKLPVVVRSFIYFLMLLLILIFGVTGGKEFIYFQF